MAKMTLEDYTDHSIVEDGGRFSPAEHETWFSFYNDYGNYAFRNWWEVEGERVFKAWVQKNLEEDENWEPI